MLSMKSTTPREMHYEKTWLLEGLVFLNYPFLRKENTQILSIEMHFRSVEALRALGFGDRRCHVSMTGLHGLENAPFSLKPRTPLGMASIPPLEPLERVKTDTKSVALRSDDVFFEF